MNRRHFLRQSTATTLLSTVAGSVSLSASAANPNDRITIGVIGVGKQARYLMGRAMNLPQTQIVSVSDVVEPRKADAARLANEFYAKLNNQLDYSGVSQHDDFRDIIGRADIDAVIVGTPDHWHAIPVIQAANAKKDIYCEKPISLTIEEGRAMVNAVKANKVVFQTGSMQRSEFDGKFRLACELVRNGRIGKVLSVNVGVGDPNRPCDLPEEEAPKDTNWDMWLGPAPWRGYNEVLCPKGIHNHFPNWRAYREYAGGPLADIGAHHFDIAQWGLGTDDTGPVKIIVPKDETEMRGLKFIYANGVEMTHGGPGGTTFIGSSGIVAVDRAELITVPSKMRETNPITDQDLKLENTGGRAGVSHMANWLDRIADRGKCICHEEIGHRSASLCHLANIGYQLRRDLDWDPKEERFTNDEAANRLLSRERRGDWKLG
ncbi:MAG: Gfo/Idh/MocA family oxidoreductase [Verrucomicrobiae bacterium]|nr:Gfo/Idh/MocA family oxidoreductase [Verrucomicrobiae bacterium]